MKNSPPARMTAMKWTRSNAPKRDALKKITSRPRPITQEDVGHDRLHNKFTCSLSQLLTIPVPARRRFGSCSHSIHELLCSLELMRGTMVYRCV